MPAREVTAHVRAPGVSLSFTVLNISTGGLMISGTRAPPRHSLLDIELALSNTRPIHVTGKVVHELTEGIGIAFEPFSTGIAESLEKLIAAVEARNNSSPPPLPPKGHKEEPAAVAHGPDPFATGPDPKPPRSGSPDERIDYLRSLLKKREEGIARGRTLFTSLAAETEELRASAAKLKAKLDTTASQLALGEASLAAARKSAEKDASALVVERETANEMLEQEQRRTLEAIGTVAGLEQKLRRLESETSSAKQDAEAARREVEEITSEAAALRKVRAELAAANKKAMEAQVALTKERTSRAVADTMIGEARAAQQAAESEAKQLGLELARLKQKLIAAEAALERSATRKVPDPQRSGPTR